MKTKTQQNSRISSIGKENQNTINYNAIRSKSRSKNDCGNIYTNLKSFKSPEKRLVKVMAQSNISNYSHNQQNNLLLGRTVKLNTSISKKSNDGDSKLGQQESVLLYDPRNLITLSSYTMKSSLFDMNDKFNTQRSQKEVNGYMLKSAEYIKTLNKSCQKTPMISKFKSSQEGGYLINDFSEVKKKMDLIQAKFLNNTNGQSKNNLKKSMIKNRKPVMLKSISSGKDQKQFNDMETSNISLKDLQKIKKINPYFYQVFLQTFRSLKNSQQQEKQLQNQQKMIEQRRKKIKQQRLKLKNDIMLTQMQRLKQKSQIDILQRKIMNKYNADFQINFEEKAIKQGYTKSRMICI